MTLHIDYLFSQVVICVCFIPLGCFQCVCAHLYGLNWELLALFYSAFGFRCFSVAHICNDELFLFASIGFGMAQRQRKKGGSSEVSLSVHVWHYHLHGVLNHWHDQQCGCHCSQLLWAGTLQCRGLSYLLRGSMASIVRNRTATVKLLLHNSSPTTAQHPSPRDHLV